MGDDDFSEGALKNISLMSRMSKTLPEDFFMVAAMQEIADVVDRNSMHLSEQDAATLLGVGALLIREGRSEMVAGIHAMLVINKAKTGRRKGVDGG